MPCLCAHSYREGIETRCSVRIVPFLGYSEHEKTYRFEKLEGRIILVSRDAQFMEDTFDNGKHEQVEQRVADVRNLDEGANYENTSLEDECKTGGIDYEMQVQPDSMSGRMGQQEQRTEATNERPQWQKRPTLPSRRQTQRPNPQSDSFPQCSQRHYRTQSLETMVEQPSAKRYGRAN